MIRAILTDIEGTTTSISFVYETLFPYFNDNIEKLLSMQSIPTVSENFKKIKQLINSDLPESVPDENVILQLKQWVSEDKKVTELKSLQGILWQEAYESGHIQGHIYSDVPIALQRWHEQNLSLNIYSSGSVPAQKLLFGYSSAGDLTPLVDHYFDTNVGHKREVDSYEKITKTLNLPNDSILFLSDIKEELDAASQAGLKTLQLTRPGTSPCKTHPRANNFNQIDLHSFT